MNKLIRDEIKLDDVIKDDYVWLEISWFQNYPDSIRKLIEKESNFVNSVGPDGLLPLQDAVLFHSTEIALMLIKSGAQVNAKGGVDPKTPLQILLGQPKSEADEQANFKEMKKLLKDNGGRSYW